ncbi:MAG: hypothetical protein O9340_02935 [Cyclobacteriaceae bacterium]|nr:hypothetical protein [Cyclobacteriaceae bacterium]
MYFVHLLIQFTGIFSVILLLIGLYKPWVVLWWEHRQDRLKVIKLYGSIAAFLFLLQWFI